MKRSQHRTRMNTFTKQYIDNTMVDLLYGVIRVNFAILTEQDINEFKKSYSKKKFDEFVAPKYNYQLKKEKTWVQNGNEEKSPEILKLVLLTEGEPDKFTSQLKTVSNENDNQSSNSSINVIDFDENEHSNPNNVLNNTPAPTRVIKVPLNEVERLHLQYFTKPIQDTIVIIANILNMISLSNSHYKMRMDESFKKKTEREKLKERCDVNRMHLRHTKVLEAKLKTNFLVVISMFSENEFVPAFQMFFLSILTVLRVLDEPKFKKGSIFKNLVLFLWTSLKNSDFDNEKVFGMFRSKEFRPDCIELITLIEESRNEDPDIAQRMAIYFVSSVNSREHFQPVINVLTSDSNEDLASLIDNASYKSRIFSQFNPREDRQEPVNRTPLVIPAQNAANVESVQKWSLSKGSSILSQVLPVKRKNGTNDETPQKTLVISNPSLISKPSVFYEHFFNSPNLSSSSELGAGALAPKVTYSSR